MKTENPITAARCREHFMNYLDANVDAMIDDFLGIELDRYEDLDLEAEQQLEQLYLQTARGIIAELHANTR